MEEKYKVIIIDDDPISMNALQFELQSYEKLKLEGTAKNGVSGIHLIERVHPDLLFLDVELPDMQGTEVLIKINSLLRSGIRVVFYTAYNKYLIEALRSQAFDFLLKPIDKKELDQVIERFLTSLKTVLRTEISGNEVSTVNSDKKFMIVSPTGDLCFLKTSEIGYFRYISERKIWEAVLNNGKIFSLRRNVTADQVCMFDSDFLQVHQSFIINLNYLLMVQDGYCVLYPPFDKEVGISVSKKYKKAMMERFLSL